MKLAISKLNYPSQPLSDDTFVVVDKEVDGTWKSYKVRLSTMKDFILGHGGDCLITEYDENSQFSETPIITYDGDNIVCEG